VLEVRIAQGSSEAGLGAATYTIRVRGPWELHVLPAHLGDAAGAWKDNGQASSWQGDTSEVVVTQTISLRQVKPGPAPMPDVRLRFREGPQDSWQEVEWLDILRQARDMAGPTAPLASSSMVWPWFVGLGVGAGFIILIMLRRRRSRAPAPVAPATQALRELDRLEHALLPPVTSAEVFHTHLSEVVRRYLAERFGLKALEQTTTEFLTAARQVPVLGQQEELLREFCERCDLAKFAQVELSAQGCRQSASLARALVERTRSSPQLVMPPAPPRPRTHSSIAGPDGTISSSAS
jgi:hypothetical protein